VLTKIGSSDQFVLNQDHKFTPHSWLSIQPIKYIANFYNDKRIIIDLDNNKSDFLLIGYTKSPITDITDIKLSQHGTYQTKIFMTTDNSLKIYLLINEKEVNLIRKNKEGNIISWLNGVLLDLKN